MYDRLMRHELDMSKRYPLSCFMPVIFDLEQMTSAKGKGHQWVKRHVACVIQSPFGCHSLTSQLKIHKRTDAKNKMAKDGVNPVHAQHKIRKKKEKEKTRREKLETKTLRQASTDVAGVKQRLDDEIKKIKAMQGTKGRKKKLPPHLQVKLSQLEALSQQVKHNEVVTSKLSIESSFRNAVFEKAERINEGLDDDDDIAMDDDDDGSIEIDPLNASLTDKARAGLLDIEALKEERRLKAERRSQQQDVKGTFEFGEDEAGSDSEREEIEHQGLDVRRESSDESNSSSSGDEIDDSELAFLPPPPPIAKPQPPVVMPPPGYVGGPISKVGFSDALPPVPSPFERIGMQNGVLQSGVVGTGMVQSGVGGGGVFQSGTVGNGVVVQSGLMQSEEASEVEHSTNETPHSWMVPASVVARLKR
eukprot:Blabericola_migrator_1__13358@NODE_947_length_5922_cov_60_770623_g657_i0_p1_GENE_NODE_947_length_5922_cov_60_770623_g657_i0NODE_947_length_5922_cov_60_770623_g657_i0_p1_ORF_typecomplete_len418_score105_95Wbp11/PF09429_10/6_9e05Wbp11/PF09429_10/2_9e03_NODE_947_length_5922_cov_60_770623_g657_i011542407